jgi:hypothetical protein
MINRLSRDDQSRNPRAAYAPTHPLTKKGFIPSQLIFTGEKMGVLKVFAPLLLQVWSAGEAHGLGEWKSHFRIVGSLKDIRESEAFVVGRTGTDLPAGWKLLEVSEVPGAIGPRELHRIVHEVAMAIQSNPERPVVIACPEYLALHNGFEAFIKFLNTVRDYALIYDGRVYLVTEKEAWEPRQYALLELLEG